MDLLERIYMCDTVTGFAQQMCPKNGAISQILPTPLPLATDAGCDLALIVAKI